MEENKILCINQVRGIKNNYEEQIYKRGIFIFTT